MNLTSIVNKLYFQPRHRELERYTHGGDAIQDKILRYLVEQGKDTEYGRNHLFSTIHSYDDFAQNIPVNTYEELKSDIDRMRHGEHNVLWPGQMCIRDRLLSLTFHLYLYSSFAISKE